LPDADAPVMVWLLVTLNAVGLCNGVLMVAIGADLTVFDTPSGGCVGGVRGGGGFGDVPAGPSGPIEAMAASYNN